MIRALAALILNAGAALAAPPCADTVFDGKSYTICTADMARDDLRLFWKDPQGQLYGQFASLDKALAEKGDALAFAMNGGMYHSNRDPVGHYVEDGVTHMRVIPSAGPGNFGLLPNGIFCIRAGRADVFETRAFLAAAPACRDATQSGPMLVINGALHPRFLKDSTSTYLRNGVGTSADGQKVFLAISNERVTFHEFGRLFRDHLKTPNALYLDGNISRLYAPALGRTDAGFPLGPIIGLVRPRTP